VIENAGWLVAVVAGAGGILVIVFWMNKKK
jgi:hypothetical protein